MGRNAPIRAAGAGLAPGAGHPFGGGTGLLPTFPGGSLLGDEPEGRPPLSSPHAFRHGLDEACQGTGARDGHSIWGTAGCTRAGLEEEAITRTDRDRITVGQEPDQGAP
jgi:hypothetical protein